ncbi:hypothetical protein GWI33_010581 [Rhynchophorus ferrugineus]|uniref:Uncharacterized protein n=1 Tax=Rhynchophorus ferrugineus TaxID=354439 RepID=A0A834IUV1_RHYFE|nr:hypothetical protein GWI33_010581 [Rhynchophorus ferrugineus]
MCKVRKSRNENAQLVSFMECSPSVRKDFFGRIIECPVSSTAKSTQHVAKNDIWYQYKEGFSNAVRKRIKISALK